MEHETYAFVSGGIGAKQLEFKEVQKLAEALPKKDLEDFFRGHDDFMVDRRADYTQPVNITIDGKTMRDFIRTEVESHPIVEKICQEITRRRELISRLAAEYCRNHPC